MLAGIDTLLALLQLYLAVGTQQAFDLANVRATRRTENGRSLWGVRNFIHISLSLTLF